MNILYVIPGSGIGGGINIVLEHVSRLRRLGVNAMILNTIGVIYLAWNPITGYTVLSRFNPSHIAYLRGLVLDLVIATGWQTVYEIIDLKLIARSFAYFIQANEAQFSDDGSFDQKLAVCTHHLPLNVLTCAHWLCQLTKSATSFALVNGINETIFHPDYPLIPKGNKLRVLIEGPISQPRKRIEDAFLACEPHRPIIDLWCVSSGGEMPDWFRPDLFLQSVPMKNMRNIYSACDVILKLSSAEGMFGPPLEMMACGGTAITSNCNGHEEYVLHDYNALVADVGDINTVTKHLGLLINDRDMLARLKRGGTETASRFRWDGRIERLRELYYEWSGDGEATTLPTFVKRRGFHFDQGILNCYKTKSYGSLAAPSNLGITMASLLQHDKSWFPVLRLSGWCCVASQEKVTSGIRFISESFRDFDDACSIVREDIAQELGHNGLYSGFDVVISGVQVPNAEYSKISVSAYATSIRNGEIFVEAKLDVFLPSAADVVAQSLDERVGTNNSTSAYGAIERGEWFRGLVLDHEFTQFINSKSSIRVCG